MQHDSPPRHTVAETRRTRTYAELAGQPPTQQLQALTIARRATPYDHPQWAGVLYSCILNRPTAGIKITGAMDLGAMQVDDVNGDLGSGMVLGARAAAEPCPLDTTTT